MINGRHEGVEIVIKYKCIICGYKYDKMESAIECFERGPGEEYPIGCIYGSHKSDRLYQNITFAVAVNNIKSGGYLYDGHTNLGASWACRDNGYGDSLGKEMCSGNSLHLSEYHADIDHTQQHFKRMVNWLRKNQIEITVWDGEKPISYATFMKKCREKEQK